MQRKRRSDIAKIVSAARDVWRQSENYQFIKKQSKVPDKPGWFQCFKCNSHVEVIKIDHIEPIGKQPDNLTEFGPWLKKLFCDVFNLQPICNACHKLKTKEERKKGVYK